MAELSSHDLVMRLNSEVFLERVKAAILKLERYIKFEDAGFPNHIARDIWRKAAMSSLDAMVYHMAQAVVTDGTCNQTAEPDDNQVYSAVEAYVNVFAES